MSEKNDKILKIVEATEKDAKGYMSDFNQKKREIDRMASKSIDLFGDSVYGDVHSIVSATKKACNTLYINLQNCIKVLNHQCTPLLEDDTPISTIEAVWQLIAKINEKSKIEASFTATLNHGNRNDVADINYMPTSECVIIEKDWENRCKLTDGYIDPETRRYIEMVKSSQELLIGQPDINAPDDRKKYEETTDEIKCKIESYHNALVQRKQTLITKFENQCNKNIRDAEESIRHMQAELNSLGLLKFSQKKQLRANIEATQVSIENLKKPGVLNNKKTNLEHLATNAEKTYQSQLDKKLNSKFKKVEEIIYVPSDLTFPSTLPHERKHPDVLSVMSTEWITIGEIKDWYYPDESNQLIACRLHPFVGTYVDKVIVGKDTKFALAGTPRPVLREIITDISPSEELVLPAPPAVEDVLK